MTIKNQIAKLMEEAKNNPVANDVFTSWAVRERGRRNLKLSVLKLRMTKEGYHHSDEEYIKLFQFLASLELCTLKKGPRGKIEGVGDFKVTLPSVGRAALGEAVEVKALKPGRVRLGKLTTVTPDIDVAPTYVTSTGEAKFDRRKSDLDRRQGSVPDTSGNGGNEERRVSGRTPRPYQTAHSNIILTFLLDNGKPISMPIPKEFTPEETSQLIDRLHRGEAAHSVKGIA